MGGDEFARSIFRECPYGQVPTLIDRFRPLKVDYKGTLIPVRCFPPGMWDTKKEKVPSSIPERSRPDTLIARKTREQGPYRKSIGLIRSLAE